MASYIRQKPPGWFVTLTLLLILWGLAGCAALYVHIAFGPAIDRQATAWDRAYYAALPGWFVFDYAIAVGAGLAGSIALWMRRRTANLLYILSLAAVVLQFGYVFAATDLIAHKGAVATVPFPLVVAGIAVFQIWLAGLATRRGWIL